MTPTESPAEKLSHADEEHQQDNFVNQNDKFSKKNNPEDVVDSASLSIEEEIVEKIDSESTVKNEKIIETILNFIEDNENKFSQYRRYFAEQQNYLKDKKMLQAKLAHNQNANNPRERVNAESIQEQLTGMKETLAHFKNKLNIDNLSVTGELLNKIINMSANELSEFKSKLIDKLNNEKQKNLTEDSRAA